MEIALNTLLVTFLVQLKVNGKCGKEPAMATSSSCTLITLHLNGQLFPPPQLPYITIRPYQYFRLTYMFQMCHRLNNPHDTAGHT